MVIEEYLLRMNSTDVEADIQFIHTTFSDVTAGKSRGRTIKAMLDFTNTQKDNFIEQMVARGCNKMRIAGVDIDLPGYIRAV